MAKKMDAFFLRLLIANAPNNRLNTGGNYVYHMLQHQETQHFAHTIYIKCSH